MSIILVIALVIILLLLAWALFGSKDEVVVTPEIKEEKPDDEPERIFRRRASDRAIEKEFPEEPSAELPPYEHPREATDTSGALQLPFSANEIIPDNSRFKLYKRTLINSEIYARRGDIETAISLYKGVHDRILDKGVREKIASNIDYLNHFRQRREEDYKRRAETAGAGVQSGELRLKIDGPVPQTINIGMPDKSIDSEQIVNKISEQISKELNSIRGEVERLKSKPEEKFDLDDYAEFASLQHELKTLKGKFIEITNDREKAIGELSRLRELKEREIARDAEREQDDILSRIRKEMENLNELKGSLDKLHNRIDDITAIKIPESEKKPAIIEARYEAPIPVHFDPKPVLEIIDRLNQQKKEKPEPEPEPPVITEKEPGPEPEIPDHELIPEEHFTEDELKAFEDEFGEEQPETADELHEEDISGELTLDEIDEFREQLPPDAETAEEELFPEMDVFPEFEKPAEEKKLSEELPELAEIPELTDEEAAGIVEGFQNENEVLHPEPDEVAEELLPEVQPEEAAFTEAEIRDEVPTPVEEAVPVTEEEAVPLEEKASASEYETPAIEEMAPEPEEELPAVHDELPVIEEELLQPEEIPETEAPAPGQEPQVIEEEPPAFKEDKKHEEIIAEPEPEILEDFHETEPVTEEPLIPDELLSKEKEREIEKHIDAEEDPNEFDLVSEYGKSKDDSTLSDEDIFEKILKEDKKKREDDTQFEIIGERQNDEQEYSLRDTRLDEKEKAEQDFYKKFIKPDRIKKRELPILKVSFDFKKLPDEFSLSREQNILEYSFYKYKPMLQKADEFIKQRRVKDALNYYKVVADQNIPVEFKAMIRKNIRDLTEYLEKYLGSE